MTWQSLLVPFTLFLILLVVVLVFIPAYLERLSRVNLTRRAEYYKLQKKLDREERRLERLLASYRRAKAEVYRSAVGQVDEQLCAQFNFGEGLCGSQTTTNRCYGVSC